jgi:hypothetical protein
MGLLRPWWTFEAIVDNGRRVPSKTSAIQSVNLTETRGRPSQSGEAIVTRPAFHCRSSCAANVGATLPSFAECRRELVSIAVQLMWVAPFGTTAGQVRRGPRDGSWLAQVRYHLVQPHRPSVFCSMPTRPVTVHVVLVSARA